MSKSQKSYRYEPNLSGLTQIAEDLSGTIGFLEEFGFFRPSADINRRHGSFLRHGKRLADISAEGEGLDPKDLQKTIAYGVVTLDMADEEFRRFLSTVLEGTEQRQGFLQQLEEVRASEKGLYEEHRFEITSAISSFRTQLDTFLKLNSRDVGDEDLEAIKVTYNTLRSLVSNLVYQVKVLREERKDAAIRDRQKAKGRKAQAVFEELLSA